MPFDTFICATQVLHFNYEHFRGNMHKESLKSDFRVKDWGSAPRWVAFVDFFLASRAKHAVISGAHRRVGTTYAQLVAALAATRNLGISTIISFTYINLHACIYFHYHFLYIY